MLNQYPRRDVAYITTANGISVVDRRQPRVVDLDSLSAHIWLRIDGLRTLQDIADHIADRYNQPWERVRPMVQQRCSGLDESGFVVKANEPTPMPNHDSLPRDKQDREKMTLSMLEAGWIQ